MDLYWSLQIWRRDKFASLYLSLKRGLLSLLTAVSTRFISLKGGRNYCPIGRHFNWPFAKGDSVKAFSENSKAESIASFLEEIRGANKEYRAIVVVMDNFSSHKSKYVMEKAKELDIYFVYLPPYSPDLNPIEFIWKSIKRELSLAFVKNLNEMKRIIADVWDKLSKKISYAKRWIEKFLKGKQYYLELCG